MATIIIRNSTGSGAVPSSLVQGELAINTVDGKLFYGSGSGNIAKEFTASNSLTASYLNTLNQDLTFNGNLTLNGTASISTLVVNQTQYSSGSNQLGDAANDTQTLYGSVIIPTGSLTVSGNVSFGTSSAGFYWDNANSYLGIKKTNPAVEIDVVGSIRATSTVFNSTTQTQIIQVNSGVSALRFFSGSVETARYDGNNWGFYTTTPTARLQVKGSGTTSATTALRVENANTSASLIVRDDGNVLSGNIIALNGAINVSSTGVGVAGNYITLNNGGFNFTNTSSNINHIRFTSTFAPTSGTGTYVQTAIEPTINQTGGANGITRGLYVNPTLTAAADFRAIETTAGNVLFQSGSTPLLFVSGSGNVGVGTSTPTNTLDIVSTTTGTLRISGSAGSQITLVRPTAGLFGYVRYLGSNAMDIGTNGADPLRLNTNNTTRISIADTGFVGIGIGTSVASALLQVRGSGATSATTAFLVQNSTPTTLFQIQDNGVVGINRTPTASLDVAGTTRLSGSFNTAASGSILTVIGSGSTQPIFTVQGSQGELFSITDSLTGSLFSVNDISGLPILEVFSDNTTLIGDYQDPMLITTKKVTMTNSGSFVVYSLPTASYDTAFFDYSIRSGSNARAGQIMAIQSGASVNFTETTTTDFGNTTAVSFTVLVSGSNMVLTGSASTGSWTIKTIVRGI